jgi:hypothetical protein
MALIANDARHEGQIAAGRAGRNRGHAFEESLAGQMSRLGALTVGEPVKHLVEGDPAVELARYVAAHEADLANPRIVGAFWLGGLATARAGDRILGPTGAPVTRSKSDVLLEVAHDDGVERIGVSVKTCFNPTPTNAQLYCSTASAFCGLIRGNGLAVSANAETALRMFCGDPGFRPMDTSGISAARRSTPERWFWEELPADAREEWENLLNAEGGEVLRILLRDAYQEDVYRPKYVMHVRHRAVQPDRVPLALFTVNQLVDLSVAYRGFATREYRVHKGRYKGDPAQHYAPRFGVVQFQPLGNTQNRNQLQFNLEASYFAKVVAQ